VGHKLTEASGQGLTQETKKLRGCGNGRGYGSRQLGNLVVVRIKPLKVFMKEKLDNGQSPPAKP